MKSTKGRETHGAVGNSRLMTSQYRGVEDKKIRHVIKETDRATGLSVTYEKGGY